MKIQYALQTCDIASNQVEKRFCCETKHELIKKCVTSFFQSLHIAAEKEASFQHNVVILDDHSSQDTIYFLEKCVKIYSKNNVSVELIRLENRGIMNSIKSCYDWLIESDATCVYQVQDDYLFEPSAITEIIDMYINIFLETNTQSIVTPYNAPYLWYSENYKNKPTPRAIFIGLNRYWIQIYDLSCSFFTSRENMIKNKDLLDYFVSLNPNTGPDLENISLNKMLVKRGMLGVCPINSIALHMQSDYERDPYVDWKKLWDSINEDIISG